MDNLQDMVNQLPDEEVKQRLVTKLNLTQVVTNKYYSFNDIC